MERDTDRDMYILYRNIDRERIDTWTGTLTVKLPGKWIKTPTKTGTRGRIGTWI
jgi:hypothetical protein